MTQTENHFLHGQNQMKKKPTKLTDLSQLSSVISFSKIDEKVYDGYTFIYVESDFDKVSEKQLEDIGKAIIIPSKHTL